MPQITAIFIKPIPNHTCMAEMLDTISNTSILNAADRPAYLYSKIKPFFSDLVVAVIILLIGLIIGKILGRVVQKVLSSLEINRLVKKSIGLRIRLEEFLGTLTSYAIFITAIIIALDVLHLTTFIKDILTVIIVAVVIFALIISIKDFVPNIIAGITLMKKRSYKEGDFIRIDSTEGQITQMDITEVRITTSEGDTIIIPNSLFLKKEVIKKHMKRKK